MANESLKTIVFEDHSQDFLEWDIDEHGVVVGCRPFQASTWCGGRVLNTDVEVGETVRYVPMWDCRPMSVRYPVEDIR